MADGVIRDFLVSLGFDTDNSGLANMRSAMDGIEWKAKALNGALLALATGAVLAVRQTASELDKLYFSSQRIGASVTNINAYGNAIAQLGGSAEGAVGSLESLAEKIRNSPGYEGQIKSLGVNTRDANGAMRDRVEVMKDLSGVLAKMPSYQANAYANSLGIDQNTLMAMRDGKFMANMEKYQKIQKELGMNDDLAKSGNEFMTEYRDLTMMTKTGFQVIVMQAGKALIPILRLLNQLIQAGIHAFSQLNPQIKEGLAVGLRFAMLALMFGALSKSLGLLLKFIPAFKTFIGLLKLFRLAFLASPIGIILALGAALALLYDDYKTWKEGGKSLFDWSKWTNGIDTIINKIKDFLDILDKIKDKTIEFIQKIITDPAGALKEVATEVQEGVAKVNDAVDKYINPTDPKKVTPTQDKVASITDFAFSMVDKGLALIGNKGAQTRVDQRDRGEIGYKTQSGSIFDATTGAAKYLLGTVQGAVGSGGSSAGYENTNSDSSPYSKIAPIKKGASGTKQVEFIRKYWGMAVKIAEALNTKPDLIISQFAAETGWGKSIIKGTNNLGNIKAGKNWKGSTVKAYDKIEKSYDPYKVYETPEDFANDYIKLVGKSKRYQNVKNTKTAYEFYSSLKKAGYATDVKYVDKGIKMHNSVLSRLDENKISPPTPSNTPKGSKALADFAQKAALPNVLSYGPPTGNPHRSQVNSSNMSASNLTVHQTFNTDMTIHGASSPVESANAVKRQQENDLAIMARGAKGIFV